MSSPKFLKKEYDAKRYLEKRNHILLQKKKYNSEHKEERNKYQRGWQKAHRVERRKYDLTPARKLRKAKKNAESRNLSFNLTIEQYVEHFYSKKCHYCADSLTKFNGACMDRKDNALGYFIENLLPCCPTCNGIRSNKLSVEEMEVAMNAIIKHRRLKLCA